TTAPSGGTGTYTYQWQYSTDNSTWTDISGATAVTYTSGALTANRYFRRAVTSSTCGTVYSASVLVTVRANLTAGAIGSAQTICYNTAPAAFTQTTAPSGGTGTYTYQWQYSTDNSAWTNISGATAVTYTSGNLTANRYFRRAVTSSTCGTVYSASILITVLPNLTAGAIGSAQSICYNTAPVAFTQTTAPAGGTGTYTYQWQYSTDNSTWTDISGATAVTYTSGNLTANRYFRRAVTSGTCTTVYSASVLITVNALPAAPTGGTPAIVCINTAASATATPPSGCTTDWYTVAAGGTAIATGNNTLSIASLAATTTYYAESRNTTTGCKSATRTAFTITVSPCVMPVNPHLRSRAGN
ncbi:MAG: hypothetical protein LBS05_06920, partial [Tannerellaceae bacterium]|nr:hypothetical protein [Tannerellaceae bacterium]